MKKIICFFLALTLTAGAFAQNTKMPLIYDIVSVSDDSDTTLDFFSMVKDGQRQYYLCVGTLGIGDEVVQLIFDPIFKLFVPLGATLDEAMVTLEKFQALYKEPNGTSIEAEGSLSAIWPDQKVEPIKITKRKPLLSNMLEFSLEREGYLRATHIRKSDFGNLMMNARFYRSIHPNE